MFLLSHFITQFFDRLTVNLIYFLTIYFLLIFESQAFEFPPVCLPKTDNKGCEVCAQNPKKTGPITSLQNLSVRLYSPKVTYDLFENKALKLKEANIVL